MAIRPDKILADLSRVVKGNVFVDPAYTAIYSVDASIYRIVPACVVLPVDTQDVTAVLRYAASERIPVAPRGAGTGVAGESLCSGIVLDLSVHLHRILRFDRQDSTVTCQGGAIMSQVNQFLGPLNLMIGPDPSSANRATVGGCIANNATGGHSLVYGHMARYVQQLEVVLADGQLLSLSNRFRPDPNSYKHLDRLASDCMKVIEANRQQINSLAARMPPRSRLGYQVHQICNDGRIDMARLIAGSEGTLAIITQATLNTVQVPKAKGLIQAAFETMDAMADAVPIIVQTGPSACELMDQQLAGMAVKAFPHYQDLLPTEAAATLLIEYTANTRSELADKLINCKRLIDAIATETRLVTDPQEQALYWSSRTDAVPLLYRQPGTKKPVPIIEDTTVDHRSLGRYIKGLQQISHRHQTAFCYYGHAGDGELHVRPYLDIGRPEGLQRLRAIADDVFELVWSLGGCISGEHAYGLLRSAYIRRQFGDDYVGILGRVKSIFDPDNIMNPGKILSDDPSAITSNIRRSWTFLPDRLDILGQDSCQMMIDCNGCGACRQRSAEPRICPVHKALTDEASSPRGKLNLIESWAAGVLESSHLLSDDAMAILDLCINCKSCQIHCPSGVDVSGLINKVRAYIADTLGLRPPELILARNARLGRLANTFAPIANGLIGTDIGRRFMEVLFGLDQSMPMPPFAWGSFAMKASRYIRKFGPICQPIAKVVYLADAFVNFYDHQLGLDVLKVLLANRIEVVIPTQTPFPLPAIYYGDTTYARNQLKALVKGLVPWIHQGYKIVVSEPSTALGLSKELTGILDDPQGRLVAASTWELMAFLMDLQQLGLLRTPAPGPTARFAYHAPCHGIAIWRTLPSPRLLEALCGVEVEVLDAGCCGLAGTYGMQASHRSLSQAMATNLADRLQERPGFTVLSECSACRLQIARLAGRQQKVIHPIQVLTCCYERCGDCL